MPTSNHTLVANKPFKRNGYTFQIGDEVNPIESNIHRFHLAGLIKGQYLKYGKIVRPWKDRDKTETSPVLREPKLKAKLKRRGGNKYDVVCGDEILTKSPIKKGDAVVFAANYNG